MKKVILVAFLFAFTIVGAQAQKIAAYSSSKLPKPKTERKFMKRSWFAINAGGGIYVDEYGDVKFGYDAWLSWQNRFTRSSCLYYGVDFGSSCYHYDDYKLNPTLYLMPKAGVNFPIGNIIEMDISLGIGFEYGLTNNRDYGYWDEKVEVGTDSNGNPNYERISHREDFSVGHLYGLRFKCNVGLWIKDFGVSLSYAPSLRNDPYGGISSYHNTPTIYTNSGGLFDTTAHRAFLNLSYRF